MGFYEISDMNSYLVDLQILVDNLLDVWACLDPNCILTKPKLHLMAHTPEDISQFGPACLYATEIHESFNAVFQRCSILSNHQNPSHDIAITLGDMEQFKHNHVVH